MYNKILKKLEDGKTRNIIIYIDDNNDDLFYSVFIIEKINGKYIVDGQEIDIKNFLKNLNIVDVK